MKSLYRILISLFLVLIDIVFLFVFSTKPQGRIWDGYSVVYIDKSVSEKNISDVFESAGCRKIVASSVQKIPLASQFLPVSIYGMDSYINSRMNYFSDESGKYRLYYVPKKYERQAEKAVAKINSSGSAKAGMDGKSGYPWFIPIFTLVFFGGLIWFSQDKLIFACCSIFPVALSFALPFSSTACWACLVCVWFFFVIPLFGRSNFISVVFKNVFLDLLIILSFFFMAGSLKAFFMGLLALACCPAMMILYHSIENKFFVSRDFDFVKIMAAGQVKVVTNRTIFVFISAAAFCLISFFCIFITGRFISGGSTGGVKLPSPLKSSSGISEKTFPVADDFYHWAWNTSTLPYRNLNLFEDNRIPAPKENDKVVVGRYVEDGNSIVYKTETVIVYNQDFRNSIDSLVDSLDYGSIESFLLKQKNGCPVEYSDKVSAVHNDRYSAVMVLLSAIVLGMMILYYYLFVSKKSV